MLARRWLPPAKHWPMQPDVTAGRDIAGGGTWMGVNAHGLLAAVLNRPGSLGQQPGKRSRGELPLLALRHSSADSAASAITALDGTDYRSFNLMLADRTKVIFLRASGDGSIEKISLPAGLHMVTARDPNDITSPRTARFLPRFAAAATPDPATGDWAAWTALLADRTGPAGSELNVPPHDGFGTVCASLLAIPAQGAPLWLFAPGPADTTPFSVVPGV